MDAVGNKSPNAAHHEIGEVQKLSKADVHLSRHRIQMSPAIIFDNAKLPNGAEESQDPVLQKLGLSDRLLNPSSPSFDFQTWSSTLVRLRSQLNVPTPPRSGFAFKSLTIQGSGPAIEEQGTVWTMITYPFNPRAWFRPKQSKTILQGLDGVVHKGELLLVLGRPGSGCTTFLRTITGHMRGLNIDPASTLQYTGAIYMNDMMYIWLTKLARRATSSNDSAVPGGVNL